MQRYLIVHHINRSLKSMTVTIELKVIPILRPICCADQPVSSR
jgi:hypothetical protein